MQYLDEQGDIEGLLAIPEAVAMLIRWANIHVDPVYYTLQQFQADTVKYNETLAGLENMLSVASVAADVNEPEGSPLTNPDYWNQIFRKAKAQASAGVTGGLALNQIMVTAIKKEIAALPKPSTPVGEITNMKLTGVSITTQAWFDTSQSIDPKTAYGQKFWDYVSGNYQLDMSDYWKCLNAVTALEKAGMLSTEQTITGHQDSLDTIQTVFNNTFNFFMMKQLNILARKNLASNLGIPENQLASRVDSKGNQVFYQKVG